MNRKTISIVAASFALVLSAVAAAPATAAPVTASHGAQQAGAHHHRATGYLACGVVVGSRPKNAQLDCRFPGHQLEYLRWSSWQKASAKGRGSLGVASAVSDDATYTWCPVDVRLSTPVKVRHGVVFSTLTYEYTGARPAGTPEQVTVPLTGQPLNPDSH